MTDTPDPARCDVVIYHNPACGTSRNVLALIRAAGIEPTVVEYLKTPYTREQLTGLLQAMDLRPREVLRTKGDLYTELGLADPALSDDALLQAIAAQPILLQRPLVVTPLGVALCRPKERVLDLL